MREFLRRHGAAVMGVLSGFDRLVFRGTLRKLAYAEGLSRYLNVNRILLKDAGAHFEAASQRVKSAYQERARKAQRPVVYLASPSADKEATARGIAERDGVQEGLIGVLTSVEVCRSFEIRRNAEARRLELRSCWRKCLHAYHYWQHREWGLMHARLQTWFPFNIQVCLNGREWLARKLSRAGLGYLKGENCFLWLADVVRAQALAWGQLTTPWPQVLDRVAGRIHPCLAETLGAFEARYYWTAYQTEWATDVMFRTPEALAELYPRLIRHGITTFGSGDVLRFLGQRTTLSGQAPGWCRGEVLSSFKRRPEGVRLKHQVGQNSLKAYDKQGCVLRVETTLNDPRAFKVYRAAEGAPGGPKTWRRMRRGVADLHRRARVSHAANQRYLGALAQVDQPQALGECLARVCRPCVYRARRVRALHPFGADAALLAALGDGSFALNGFRNRDLQGRLWAQPPASPAERRRHSARVTRLLRLLRAHGLIQKVPTTHRYQLTAAGQLLVVALGAAREASIKKLTESAA